MNNMPERLLKQFKQLDRVSPSTEWTENTRSLLLKKIERETIGLEPTWPYKFRLFFVVWSRRIIPSPFKMVAVFAILAVMFGTNLVVEAEIVPVGTLEMVQRSVEKIQLFLAVTPESEIKVNLNYMQKRQRQALAIANKAGFSPEEKARHLNKVVKYLEGNVLGAANSLAIAKQGSGNNQQKQGEVAKLAIEITKNSQEAVKTLDQVKESADLKNLDKTVSESQSVIEASGVASLSAVVGQVQEHQLPEGVVPAEQVKDVISGAINRESEKIEQFVQKFERVGTVDFVITYKKEVPKEEIKELNQQLSEAVENNEKAKVILDEAKNSLANDNLAEAMGKVKESTEITRQSKAVAAKIEGLSAIKDDVKNSTSSDRVINIKKDDNKATTTRETTPKLIEPISGQLNQSLIMESNTSTAVELPCLNCFNQ